MECGVGYTLTTCGEFGLCQTGGGGGCAPNWQRIYGPSTGSVYMYAEWDWETTSTHCVANMIGFEKLHDANECPGNADVYTCYYPYGYTPWDEGWYQGLFGAASCCDEMGYSWLGDCFGDYYGDHWPPQCGSPW